MKRLRGCLTSVPTLERRLLGLRAGLDGPPRSRSDAAATLQITPGRAARLEHHGLALLRDSCRSSARVGAQGFDTRAASLVVRAAGSMPTLQPAVLLPGAVPALMPRARLAPPQGAVKGAYASSPPEAEAGGQALGSIARPILSAAPVVGPGASTNLLVLLLALAAATAGAGLIARRRNAATHAPAADAGILPAAAATKQVIPEAPRSSLSPKFAPPQARDQASPNVESPPAAPEPPVPHAAAAPMPAPSTQAAQPSEARGQAQPAAGRLGRARRPAAMVASGLVSVVVREIVKRRRR